MTMLQDFRTRVNPELIATESDIVRRVGVVEIRMTFSPLAVKVGNEWPIKFTSRMAADIYMARQMAYHRGYLAFFQGGRSTTTLFNEDYRRGWNDAVRAGYTILCNEREYPCNTH